MPTVTTPKDPRGYGAIPASDIIATSPVTKMAWRLCNRRVHVMRALAIGPNAKLSAELALIDAALLDCNERIDRALDDCLASMLGR